MARTKVLLVELNEITWDLIDPLMAQGKLPTFARLKREGVWAAPMSVDLPPQLDPWITWTTLYTGCPQAVHNVYFLEQPPETIRARRIWEICRRQGLKIGVYGSLCSWPPQRVNGFYVPDTFARDSSTYPESLQPIQELNLTYTRSIRLPSDQDSLMFKAKLGAKLIRLGLRPATMARIAKQLASERVDAGLRWRRVGLQPLVNFDFFSKLYLERRPDFATFHSNHVAHYMHTYWKAMQPEAFEQGATEDEIRRYGGAIEYGYRTADELLQRVLSLLDTETTLVVASSMGQKPFVSQLRDGKPICQLRSLDRLLEILEMQGKARTLSMMSDQFNIYFEDAGIREELEQKIRDAYVDAPEQRMFAIVELGDCLTASLNYFDDVSEDSRCVFPHLGERGVFRYSDLVYNTGHIKSGCHDPRGMMLLYGAGIRAGGWIKECDNLDVAPTLLKLMGMSAPPEMKGRVLTEAFARTHERFEVAA
ncbi:MAG: alkaline phosphatase family protein [Blastocatellia bacterium]